MSEFHVLQTGKLARELWLSRVRPRIYGMWPLNSAGFRIFAQRPLWEPNHTRNGMASHSRRGPRAEHLASRILHSDEVYRRSVNRIRTRAEQNGRIAAHKGAQKSPGGDP